MADGKRASESDRSGPCSESESVFMRNSSPTDKTTFWSLLGIAIILVAIGACDRLVSHDPHVPVIEINFGK